MIIVTGKIGCGKSHVAEKIATDLGFELIDADKIGHEVLKEKKVEVKKEFGTADRTKLGEIVFDDRYELQKLNTIVHPRIREIINEKVMDVGGRCVIDAALFDELKVHEMQYRGPMIVVVVNSMFEVIAKRKKDHNLKLLENVYKLQKVPTKYDYYIENNGTMAEFGFKIEDVIENIREDLGIRSEE